jgi:hypothetical protein
MEMTKVEYRIRPVTRYVVTRYHEGVDRSKGVACNAGGCEERGEFKNADTAYAVGYALAKQEHQALGWPVGDERIIYPVEPEGRLARLQGESGLAATVERIRKMDIAWPEDHHA